MASEAQGLDSERDALRIILDAVLTDAGLALGSDEYGLWLERITKRIVTMRKPARKVASGAPLASTLAATEKGVASPVAFPQTPAVELEGDRGGSFYLTTLDPPDGAMSQRAVYVNE